MADRNISSLNFVKLLPKPPLTHNLKSTPYTNPTTIRIPATSTNTISDTRNSDTDANSSTTTVDTNSSNGKENDISFKGDSLQQLSTNALPPYVPSSPPTIAMADVSTYEYNCCTDCGDTFALKSSLKFHLERRSVLIKFSCDACRAMKIFYNRCTLWSHIRSHTDKVETADISKAIVNPLPRIYMEGFQNESSNCPDEDSTPFDDGVSAPATDLLEFSLQEAESENIGVEKDDSNHVRIKCLDCNEEFESSEERALHYTNNDKIPLVNHHCNKCDVICPSKCFLKAHQRIHLQVSPYICPECGDSPSPMWQKFLYHVKFKCFHNARSVGYKCPLCKRLSPNKDSLLKHMELHTDKFIKCDSCIRAFMTINLFNVHVTQDHPGTKASCSIIYKCALCDIVFLAKDQLVSHRETHVKDQVCEFVFNCMQCGKPLETKIQLNDHIKTSHPKTFKSIMEKFEPEALSQEPPVVAYRGKVECMLCNCFFHSQQGYQAHLKKAHVNHNMPCVYCYMVLVNRQRMMEHGKKHLNKGAYLCLLCNNKKWADAKQLNTHLMKHVTKIQYCTCCPICDVILKTPPEAVSHLQEEHMLFEEMGKSSKILSLKKPVEIFTCHFCRESFEKDDELQDHLQVKHKIDEIKQNKSDVGGEEPSAKRMRLQNDGNLCAKCDFHSNEREEFKKHILTHKTNKTTLQCQECGLCFVVEPALAKHLRIAHKVTDTKRYIETEGTNCVPDIDCPAEVSPCNSLLCSVCFTTFPNETSLKTHMRSHGMAFIHKLQNPPTSE